MPPPPPEACGKELKVLAGNLCQLDDWGKGKGTLQVRTAGSLPRVGTEQEWQPYLREAMEPGRAEGGPVSKHPRSGTLGTTSRHAESPGPESQHLRLPAQQQECRQNPGPEPLGLRHRAEGNVYIRGSFIQLHEDI